MEPSGVAYFERPDAFRAWMLEHHEGRDELWVGYWKKATGRPSLTWEESVDVALCFGWIDGIRKRVDEEAYTVRFTPRRKGSVWSLRNVERYGILDAEGLVHASGRAAWARRTEAKTGLYSFEREEPARLAPPYEARLRADGALGAAWDARPPGYRRRMTHWVMSAKREETRTRRLERLMAELREAGG